MTPTITPERQVDVLESQLIDRRLVTPGSVVVFISVSPDMTRTDANFLNVQRLG